MEQIKGRIRRLWKRRPKGRISSAVMAAALMLSTVFSALSPVVAYAANTNKTAQVEITHVVTYGGLNQNTCVRQAIIDGQTSAAYCMEPALAGQYNGPCPVTKPSTSLPRYDELRADMWFSYGSPGFDASLWPSTWYDGSPMDADKYYILAHILLADTYSSDYSAAVAGCTDAFKQYVDHYVLYDNVYGDGSNYANTTANKIRARISDVPDEETFQIWFLDLRETKGQPGWPDYVDWDTMDAQMIITFTYEPNGFAQVIKTSANPSITNGNDCYSFEGAQFTFYDASGAAVGTVTANAQGVTNVLELPVGTYTVKETKVPEGYLAAPDQQVTINSQQTAKLTFADPPAGDPASILVGKYDGDTTYNGETNLPQGSASLEGAEFTVEYYDTLDYESYDAIKEASVEPTRSWIVRTDSDGFATLTKEYLISGDELYYSNGVPTLPRGTVVVYESKAPDGYNLNSDFLSFQQIQENPLDMSVTYNTPQVPESVKRGGVSVQKVDSQTGMTPQGSADFANIVFEIVNNNENDVIVNGKSAAKGEVAMTITTDENGYAATAEDALPYGDYILREQMRGDGTANGSYLVTAEDIPFTISEDGDFKKLTASDDVSRGGVEVYKRDIESGLDSPLGGAASFDGTLFEVRSLNENPVIVDGVTYGKGAVVTTLTIKDGYACTAADTLPYGDYTLQEVKATEGYNLTDGTAYPFEITVDGDIVNPVTGGAVRNQVKRSDLEFSKKADDTADRLAGVAFKLTSVTTGESHVIVTDENGYFNSASSWNSHTVNTNGNDWALDVADGETIDSSQLDATAGVWFGLATDGNITAADDGLGALPYDRYTIEELPCTSNEGYTLINTSVTITRHGVTYDFGTLDDVKPYISTNAYDPSDGDSSVAVGSVSIADKVTYTGLAKGSQYRLVTTVVDAATGEAITVDGEAVSATTTFTAEDTAGFVVAEMTIPTYELGGKNITIYEELYLDGGSLMAEHKDKDDIDQQLTVIAPEIGTNAKDGVDGDKSVVSDDTTTVVDEVSYKNLVPGKEYTLTGTLHVRGVDEEGNVTEEALVVNGEPVTSEVTFTPESANGSVDVTFTFDSLGLEAGTEVVAFESLYMDGYEIAVHADINDENQTVKVIKPEIGTTAKDGVDGDKYVVADTETAVVDTVEYKDLVPGKEYTLTGTLMVKGLDEDGNVTEDALMVNDEPVTSEVTFTPESADGSVDVTFTFDSSALEGGTELVAFESLYRCDVELATHADINDEAQSVTIIRPAIATNAADGFDGDKEVVADAESTVVDTVTYTNLIPGKEYTLTGTLMVKGLDEDGNVTEEPLMVNDEPVTSEVTFTPESADGSVDLTFTFDSSALDDGTKVVAFESLKRGEVEIAVHADINDEAQTVTIRETVIGTIARDGLDGDKDVIVDTDTHVADTVAYTDVLPGSAYTMTGILMDKQSGLPILTGDGSEKYTDDDVSGFVNELAELLGLASMSENETTDEVASDDIDMAAVAALFNDNEDLVSHMVLSYEQFTPETSAGSVNIDFAFDANEVIDRLSGETKDIVVFEVLFKGSFDGEEDTAPVIVASELDLDNDEQTVTLGPSSIGTVALDASDGDHSLMPGKDAVITDTVTYNGLIPGKEYTLKATLMDKATGEPLSVGDKHVTAEMKFTPNEQYGTIDIDLGPFDASSLEGHDLVVFEELYKQSIVDGEATEILVAEHKDINDADQTVTVTSTPPGTTVDRNGGYYGKTGGSTTPVVLAIAALVVIAGALVAYGIKNRRSDGSDSEMDATLNKLNDGSDR